MAKDGKSGASDPLSGLPSAKEVMMEIAKREAEKASAAMRELSAADTEKQALIEKFSKPSGVSDDERLARAAAIIRRAASNGQTEVEIFRFPHELCTDRGRAINQNEAGWEKTLRVYPRSSLTFGINNSNPKATKWDFRLWIFPAVSRGTSA